jgi:hypothetical protein
MLDTDKKEFKLMMKIVCQNYSHAEFDGDNLRFWFSKFEKYDLKTVGNAFDNWLDNSKFMPTVKDILDACKPVTPIYNAIARKSDREHNKIQADKIIRMIESNTKKPARNWVKYWTDILDNPKQHKEITLTGARQALVNLGVRK